jgi:hypothetical protein
MCIRVYIATSLYFPYLFYIANDLIIVQHAYGIIQNFFYYSLYPFDQWNKQIMNFHFIDVLFIPYKQLAIFELV